MFKAFWSLIVKAGKVLFKKFAPSLLEVMTSCCNASWAADPEFGSSVVSSGTKSISQSIIEKIWYITLLVLVGNQVDLVVPVAGLQESQLQARI